MVDGLSTFRLDRRSDLGVAAQIRAQIALLIADGELAAGERLPPVRQLARQLEVNVNTVRSAYAGLEADGRVHTRHGVGTEVLATHQARPISPAIGTLGANAVAVLIAGLDPFYLALLRGVEDIAARQGTLVLIVDTRDSPALAEAEIRRLAARGINGIIAVSVGGLPSSMPGADGAPPIVYVDQPERKGHVLLFDGHGGGYIATRHLLEHGHERLGIVTAPLSWPNVKDVYDGYVHALEDAALGINPELVSEVGEFTVEAGRLGLAHLLDKPNPPTAVFAAGETLALGVLHEARSRQVEVPASLAIAGYTDSPTTALVDPPLTMVAVPAREIGMQAMRTLSELTRGKHPRARTRVLDVELVVRDSCGSHGAAGDRSRHTSGRPTPHGTRSQARSGGRPHRNTRPPR
jgi:LacI family transcriptional regulator, galactose operon repressor